MTPLFKKMNFKNQASILVLDAPQSFNNELTKINDFTSVVKNIEKTASIEFAIIFVTEQKSIDKTIQLIASKLIGDVILWFCYPKKTSKKFKCDFNRDTGWDALGKFNFEGVKQVAIDEDWSALRFRKTTYIKTLTRKKDNAISIEGKKRTSSTNKT